MSIFKALAAAIVSAGVVGAAALGLSGAAGGISGLEAASAHVCDQNR
jgi:hypothetical protein